MASGTIAPPAIAMHIRPLNSLLRLGSSSTVMEKIMGQKGDRIELPNVLYCAEGENILVGTPYLANVKVVGEILDQRRAKKVIVFKMKRRKGYHKRQGHRQSFTTVRIKEINIQ